MPKTRMGWRTRRLRMRGFEVTCRSIPKGEAGAERRWIVRARGLGLAVLDDSQLVALEEAVAPFPPSFIPPPAP